MPGSAASASTKPDSASCDIPFPFRFSSRLGAGGDRRRPPQLLAHCSSRTLAHDLNDVQVILELCSSQRQVPYSGHMPRDTLTREQIVKAAIDLLDTEGLDGLNMRALGKRLGSAATAVYWHVGSKDNLIALAADQAWHEIALPGLTPASWRAAATAMATGLHAMLTRHPWLVQAFGSQVLFGTGKARHDDHTLAIYEAAGFTGEQADQAAASGFTLVL